MGTFDFDPLDEGSIIKQGVLNAAFDELGGTAQGLNNLDESSVDREALSSQHLPELSMSDVFTTGYTAIAPTAAAGFGVTHSVYKNILPLTGGPAYPYTYQTFYTGAPDAWAPYGETSVAGPAAGGLGWAIVAFNQTSANAAEVTLGAATTLDAISAAGVLVRGGINVRTAGSGGTGVGVKSVAVGIGFEDSGGTRYVIERSVRFYSRDAIRRGDAATSTFITQADLDALGGAATQVASFFMVIAGCEPDSGLSTLVIDIETGYYNLTVLPIQAGAL